MTKKSETENLGGYLDACYADLAAQLQSPLHKAWRRWQRELANGKLKLADIFRAGTTKGVLGDGNFWEYLKRKTIMDVAKKNDSPAIAALTGQITAARNKIVELNTDVVAVKVCDYRNCGVDDQDLMQEGMIGLMWAADRYSPQYNRGFYPYAEKCVAGHLMLALTNMSRTVKLTAYAYNEMRDIQKAKAVLTEKLGREPGIQELADHLKLSADKVKTGLENLTRSVSSLDEPLVNRDGEKFSLYDVVADENAVDPGEDLCADETGAIVDSALQNLSQRDEFILRSRFGVGKPEQTLQQLGDKLHLSHQAIKQAEVYAGQRLRRELEGQGLGKDCFL